MVQNVFGICEAKNGTTTHELLQTGTEGYQRIWQDDEKNPDSRGMKSPSQRGKELENRVRKEKNYEIEVSVLNKFEMEGLVARKGLWNLAKEKIMKERGELPNEVGDAVREYKAIHEEDFWSNWLREYEKSKEETKAEAEGKGEEEGEKRKREEEEEENEKGTVKRRR